MFELSATILAGEAMTLGFQREEILALMPAVIALRRQTCGAGMRPLKSRAVALNPNWKALPDSNYRIDIRRRWHRGVKRWYFGGHTRG